MILRPKSVNPKSSKIRSDPFRIVIGMPLCAFPVVLIEDFDKMCADKLRDPTASPPLSDVSPSLDDDNDISSENGVEPGDDESESGSELVTGDDSQRKRKISGDGVPIVRKRSSSNLFYRCSKAFEEARSRKHAASHRHKLDPNKISSSAGGLRKHLLMSRRSPSPHPQPLASTMSPGYEQYQMSLLEVPLPRDYGEASSDDLSSEWDSDASDSRLCAKDVKVMTLYIGDVK